MQLSEIKVSLVLMRVYNTHLIRQFWKNLLSVKLQSQSFFGSWPVLRAATELITSFKMLHLNSELIIDVWLILRSSSA